MSSAALPPDARDPRRAAFLPLLAAVVIAAFTTIASSLVSGCLVEKRAEAKRCLLLYEGETCPSRDEARVLLDDEPAEGNGPRIISVDEGPAVEAVVSADAGSPPPSASGMRADASGSEPAAPARSAATAPTRKASAWATNRAARAAP